MPPGAHRLQRAMIVYPLFDMTETKKGAWPLYDKGPVPYFKQLR